MKKAVVRMRGYEYSEVKSQLTEEQVREKIIEISRTHGYEVSQCQLIRDDSMGPAVSISWS